MLFNIHDGAWDAELLKAMRIPDSMLPEVRPSSGEYGQVSTTLGLEDIAIGGVAGDQQAALFGQACFRPGMAKCTYGTGAFLLQTLGAGGEAVHEPAADHSGLAGREQARVRDGRQRLHCRFGRAMAARWAGNHSVVGGGRGTGAKRSR